MTALRHARIASEGRVASRAPLFEPMGRLFLCTVTLTVSRMVSFRFRLVASLIRSKRRARESFTPNPRANPRFREEGEVDEEDEEDD